ncbi:glutamate racemase [Arhodomonas sp. AD133]|uniref:glutamate racemase n=1 Tax=Arhodomonas sp. AD133 TaxID=3415009 RepID=UPI003EBCC33E
MTSDKPEPSDPCAVPTPIALWDSGVGGLTVLRALRRERPDANYHYFADNAHAPYGIRSADRIRERADAIVDWCTTIAAGALVVACNTATAAAVEHLRSRLDIPVVGMEPGLKPATRLTRNGRVGILATAGTLASERFRVLRERYARSVEVVIHPCPELVTLAERGEIRGPAARAAVTRAIAPFREAAVDTLVLGCTHFPLFRRELQTALGPDVRLVDTASAVARRTLHLLSADINGSGRIVLSASGDPSVLEALAEAQMTVQAPYD